MLAIKGRLQKEGEVIHVIAEHVTNHDAMLRAIGRIDFTIPPNPADGATTGGGPAPRDPSWNLRGRTLSSPPFGDERAPADLIPIRSHDFH